MRAKWLWMMWLAGLAAGCGPGHLIFSIDVYSFLKGAGAETLPYAGPLPPGVPDTIPAQQINAIGIGTSSIVDTVRLTGTVDFVNSMGTGNVTFQVYFDSVASTLYSGVPAFTVTGAVTGTNTTTSPFDILNVPDAFKPLFLASKVFVGIRASATATAPPVTGTAKLTSLNARVVIQDKFF